MPDISTTEEKEIVLSKSQQEELVKFISSKFKEFDNKRKMQLNDAKILLNLIDRDAMKEIEFNKLVNTDDLYELRETLRANLFRHLESSVENFTVIGEDETSYNNAVVQKENILNSQRKMKIKDIYKKCIDDFCIYGELITFTDWHEKTNEIQRPKTIIEKIQDSITGLFSDQPKEKLVRETKTVYKGARVKQVLSKDFVYDVDCECFDSALKIQVKYSSFQQVRSQEAYNIPKEMEDAYKTKLSKDSKDETQYVSDLKEESENKGNNVKLIEAWGDIVLSDGTPLNNYRIVVADDRWILNSELNPYIDNPYTISIPIKDHRTKRGISPLKVAISHNLASSYILTKMLAILDLIQNPAWFGPKGANIGNVGLTPGKYVAFENWADPNFRPEPYKPDGGILGFQFIEKFKSTMQACTGIFPYATGIDNSNTRTATESTNLMTGQQIRQSMIDDYMKDFQLKNIEKIANITANFKFGDEKIIDNNADEMKITTITDEVRQGNYSYEYTDRRSWIEKKDEMNEFSLGLERFIQAGAKVNINYAFQEWLKMQEKKNIEKYITLDPVEEVLKQVPPEEHESIKQQLAQVLQGQIQLHSQQGIINEQTPQTPMYPNENTPQLAGV